jgi:hypothetical protein
MPPPLPIRNRSLPLSESVLAAALAQKSASP